MSATFFSPRACREEEAGRHVESYADASHISDGCFRDGLMGAMRARRRELVFKGRLSGERGAELWSAVGTGNILRRSAMSG
ncbi:hypothetical protein VZT92_014487 [Zoarces viviparus]|uniref:Uncharacterized protein n=1 Tax=Zoarces viviparus TaxID=48416 RepID=A0AAW1EZV2_ZOAVI